MQNIDWDKQDRESFALFEKQCKEQMKRSTADRDFSQAVLNAKIWTKGIHPIRDENGAFVYSQHQTSMAACDGREDVSAVIQVQLPILKRLDRIEKLAFCCFIALPYVCFKVS